MELTVIIPTRGRRAILTETLSRLEREVTQVDFEVIVVDDGSADGTPGAEFEQTTEHSFPLAVIPSPGRGPAAARNRALAMARAPVCLFIDDDSWPRNGLLLRHRDFHGQRTEREVALLGRIDLPHVPPPTPFMRWLAAVHVDSEGIEDAENAGGDHFFTGNVSAKTAFLRSVGGFDERFTDHEDIELGLRLEQQGMRLVYEPDAVVEHYSPMSLSTAIDRMRSVGRSLALLVERFPGYPAPRRPGMRHRVNACLLTALAATGVRTRRLQHETWRFLCHEATREAYWDAIDRREGGRQRSGAELRIGRTLARLATRDQDARMPGPSSDSAAEHLQSRGCRSARDPAA
jgi:GT2 family glycosyltransferase